MYTTHIYIHIHVHTHIDIDADWSQCKVGSMLFCPMETCDQGIKLAPKGSFPNRSTLRKHLNGKKDDAYHNNYWYHMCHHCGKRYGSRYLLAEHQKRTGQKYQMSNGEYVTCM